MRQEKSAAGLRAAATSLSPTLAWQRDRGPLGIRHALIVPLKQLWDHFKAQFPLPNNGSSCPPFSKCPQTSGVLGSMLGPEQDTSGLWGRSCPFCSNPGALVRAATHRPSHLLLSQAGWPIRDFPGSLLMKGRKQQEAAEQAAPRLAPRVTSGFITPFPGLDSHPT